MTSWGTARASADTYLRDKVYMSQQQTDLLLELAEGAAPVPVGTSLALLDTSLALLGTSLALLGTSPALLGASYALFGT